MARDVKDPAEVEQTPAGSDAAEPTPPAAEVGPDAAAAPAADEIADEPGTVELVLLVDIGGTREGVPVPAPGGTIVLDAAEAAEWVRFGYAVPADAAE